MPDSVRLEEGALAPDFTLPDQHGTPFTLSSTRGQKTIVYFYGEAGTPAATACRREVRPHAGPPGRHP